MAENFDARAAARSLLRAARKGALATLDHETGCPYASLVAVATAADGAPILLLSSLARHTRNLSQEPRASLLLEEDGLTDLAGARLTIWGRIAPTAEPAERARYLARHDDAATFTGFRDFSFYRLEPEGAHLVAGFGRINSFVREQVMTATADAAELLQAEADAAAHMNEDHRDALALYAEQLLGAPAGKWRCDGLDPEGLELSCSGRAVYLPFPKRARGPGALREVLKQLAQTARDSQSLNAERM